MDVSRLNEAGFEASITLEGGISAVYAEFQQNYEAYVKGRAYQPTTV